MKKPTLTIGTAEEGYVLKGWEELDHWCMLNDPIWRQATHIALRSKLSKHDRTKLLVFSYMNAYEAMTHNS